MGSFETSEAPGEDRALEQADEEEFVVWVNYGPGPWTKLAGLAYLVL